MYADQLTPQKPPQCKHIPGSSNDVQAISAFSSIKPGLKGRSLGTSLEDPGMECLGVAVGSGPVSVLGQGCRLRREGVPELGVSLSHPPTDGRGTPPPLVPLVAMPGAPFVASCSWCLLV